LSAECSCHHNKCGGNEEVINNKKWFYFKTKDITALRLLEAVYVGNLNRIEYTQSDRNHLTREMVKITHRSAHEKGTKTPTWSRSRYG
jgi:hypothetical protein